MIRLGLIGYPLSHSLSPVIHTAALQACGLEGSYSLFPIHSEDRPGLKELLERVRRGEVTGLNVTIPHKQNVIEFLDELTPTSQTIGAVNTIYKRENRLIGENTDAPGFLTDLKWTLQFSREALRPPSALVLGAGGSARAVVYALLKDGWEITIAARRLEQAEQLADSFAKAREASLRDQLSRSIPAGPIIVCELSNLQALVSNLSLIVNTTPVGMAPNIDQSPWPENLPFPSHAAIYDLVYNPRKTRLVRNARLQGRPATTGLGMLIEQAALAFEIWTDQNPSRDVLRASVAESPVSNF